MAKKSSISFRIIFSSVIAALGAFLFGYHTGIISGAGIFITKDFSLSTFEQEWIVSIILVGCLIGALSAGISDYLGRKRSLFLTGLIFILATFCILYSYNFFVLLIGRLLAGFAVGLASISVPLYIAEISPTKERGKLVSINQLMITIGIFTSYVIAHTYADTGNWRAMFAISLIPTLLLLIGLFVIPESPHWLVGQGLDKEAAEVGHLLHIPAQSYQSEEKKKKASWSTLLSSKYRRPFIIGIGISLVQQVTGINTVIYYSPHIFQLAGFGSAEDSIGAAISIAVVLVLATFLGLCLIDRIGRRSLALIGLAGMAISLLFLSCAFLVNLPGIGWIAMGSLIAYIAFFSASLGIIAWVLISEIYPLSIRGRAMSLAGAANWAGNFFVSLTFLSLIQFLSIGGAYLCYAVICVIGFYFVWKLVPETKGKTFEQIQSFWKAE